MHKPQLLQLFEEDPELNIAVHEYNINVTTNDGEIINSDALFEEFEKYVPSTGETAHLYIHVPLCDYICNFCNYVKKKIGKDSEEDASTWMELLKKEALIYLSKLPWMSEIGISSFYIGGGTGALLLSDKVAFGHFIKFIKSNYNFTSNAELSLEGNPENFTSQNIKFAMDLGFNRFSVGVQSLDDSVNHFANRLHSESQSIAAIKELKKTGLPFSVDMMFGLPLQTIDSVSRDIKMLVELKVPAITIYRLRNSDREKMGIGNASAWNQEKIKTKLDNVGSFPSVLDTYLMRDIITKVLIENDYEPSPCGWWNKKGLYPNGNIPQVSKDKWENYKTMLALGPGGYGWLSGTSSTYFQTHNQNKIHDYMAYMNDNPTKPPLKYGRILSGNLAIGTKLSFAVKARQPIFIETYKSTFGINILEDEPYRNVFIELIEKGFLFYSSLNDSLNVTLKGETLHEEIMKVYFLDRIGASEDIFCKKTTS